MKDKIASKVISDLLETADRLSQSGYSGAAVDILSKGLKHAPHEKKLYYALTEIFLEQEHFQEALDTIGTLSSVSFDIRSAELKAECLERMQRFAEALNIVDQILDIDQYSASALNLKGLLLYQQNELNEAAFYFEKSIHAAPTNGRAHINLALLRLDKGLSEAAIEILKKGFIRSPHIKQVASTFHEVVCEIGAFAEAEEMFRDAFRRYPMNKRLAYLLTDILIRQDKLKDAMKAIEASMAIFGFDDGILKPALKIRNSFGPLVINSNKRSNGSISLCMIVKNEEKNLARCLASVTEVVDEIVVVDTGSSDRSADIAKVFGAKVYTYDWHNDFSDARNFSLSKAKGAWVFILDADEILAVRDHSDLPALTRIPQTEICAYRFITRNYTNDVGTEGWQANNSAYQQEQAGKGWYPSEKVRFFPNDDRIRFENPVHELVEPSLRRARIPLKKCPIPIHHYGTLNREKEVKKKATYYSLGKEKIANNHTGATALIEHAIQAQEVGEYEEALNLWEAVLKRCPEIAKAHFNISYSYIQLERYKKGLEAAKKSMKLDPNLKEAVLNCALCLIRLGDTKQAIEHLNRLLIENPNHPMGIGLLAVALCITGQRERGLELFDEIHNMGFNCPEYIVDHVQKLDSVGRMQDAFRLVDSIVDSSHENEKIRSFQEALTRYQVVSSTLRIQVFDLKDVNQQILQYLNPLDDYRNLDEQFFSPVTNEKNADFILFPYAIDPSYHHLGYEEFINFLRQLPFFSQYEHKFVFFLMDDISPRFDIDSVIYRVNHDKRKKDKNSITLPYFVDDIYQIPLSDKLMYHVNFIGTIVTHVLRAYMLIPFLDKAELALYDALLGKLDKVLANRKNNETYQTVMADAMTFAQQLFPLTPALQGINYFLDISVEQFHHLPKHIQDAKKSEFVDIMSQSVATLCPRGFGVQSIRFYETLSAGRIPILISDHYVLPLENLINYSAFTWQVDEGKISNLQNEVLSFFNSYTADDLIQKAKAARDVWQKYFAPSQRSRFIHLTLAEVLKANYRLN